MMEMPEGWNRLKRTANLLGMEDIIWISRQDKDQMLDLMKEIAEALEDIRYGGSRRSIGIVPNRCPQCASEETADEILKKFKEWK